MLLYTKGERVKFNLNPYVFAYMPIFAYAIGNLSVVIDTSLDLSCLSLYKPFIANHFMINPDISIRIQLSNTVNIKALYHSLGETINNNATYSWVKHTDKYYLIFSKRLQKLSEAEASDIWILECNDNFSKCILSIPFCHDTPEIISELLRRPWLQRLFIAHSWKSNYIVFHGALIEFEGTGLIFLGDSGSGKSTMCDIIKDEKATIIADDRFIMKKNICYGTPWNIKNPHYSINSKAKVSKIFILSHGSNNIENIGNNYITLTHGIFTSMLLPSYISQTDAIIWKTSWLSYIKKNFEIYSFAFQPDKSVIPYLRNTKEHIT